MSEQSDGDAIRAALRYRLERFRREELGEEIEPEPEQPTRAPTDAERAAAVAVAIQQSMRRGDFDNLPGAGKPLPGIRTDSRHDPDWWMRRKIEREQLRGIGPAAYTLRTEDAELDAKLDALHRADDVRTVLDDFNLRVIEARRQLLGGPPVVTNPRDVDAEVAAWEERRAARRTAPGTPAAEPPRRRTWMRRGHHRADV